MSLSVGIVGFPNVGKSTLFQALTKNQVGRSNYPFCTIDPNIGIVSVPDERLDHLANLYYPKKKVSSVIKFIDIAGLVDGASQGRGLGNRFLANIRETDLILYILRAFKDDNVISVRERINPLEEAVLLETELALKDLETIEKRLASIKKEAKTGDKKVIAEVVALESAKKILEAGGSLIEAGEDNVNFLHPYRFLTIKPKIYLLNGKDETMLNDLVFSLGKGKWPVLLFDVLAELERVEFNTAERIELGLPKETKMDELIRTAYNLLDLITFFTIGEEEVRAWKTIKGTLIPEAAGIIHTDFKDKFIKADVISWGDFLKAGSLAEARRLGFLRTEGKEYVVRDGDIIEIKHGA